MAQPRQQIARFKAPDPFAGLYESMQMMMMFHKMAEKDKPKYELRGDKVIRINPDGTASVVTDLMLSNASWSSIRPEFSSLSQSLLDNTDFTEFEENGKYNPKLAKAYLMGSSQVKAVINNPRNRFYKNNINLTLDEITAGMPSYIAQKKFEEFDKLVKFAQLTSNDMKIHQARMKLVQSKIDNNWDKTQGMAFDPDLDTVLRNEYESLELDQNYALNVVNIGRMQSGMRGAMNDFMSSMKYLNIDKDNELFKGMEEVLLNQYSSTQTDADKIEIKRQEDAGIVEKQVEPPIFPIPKNIEINEDAKGKFKFKGVTYNTETEALNVRKVDPSYKSYERKEEQAQIRKVAKAESRTYTSEGAKELGNMIWNLPGDVMNFITRAPGEVVRKTKERFPKQVTSPVFDISGTISSIGAQPSGVIHKIKKDPVTGAASIVPDEEAMNQNELQNLMDTLLQGVESSPEEMNILSILQAMQETDPNNLNIPQEFPQLSIP